MCQVLFNPGGETVNEASFFPCGVSVLVEKAEKILVYKLVGLPGWLSGKESACQCRIHKTHGFHPWVRKIPWRRK